MASTVVDFEVIIVEVTGIVARNIIETIVLRVAAQPPLDVPVSVHEAHATQVAVFIGGDDSDGYGGGRECSAVIIRGAWSRKTARGRRGRSLSASDG